MQLLELTFTKAEGHTPDPVKCGVTKMACLVYIRSDYVYFKIADLCLDVFFP